MQSPRKTTGVSRINRGVQARLFRYIDTNVPRRLTPGIDSKCVSDAVELWLELVEAYSMAEFVAEFDGLSPAEILVPMLREYREKGDNSGK